MKISNILIEHQLAESKQILAESCDGLTDQQRHIVEGIYKEFRPLIEATLTAQQIQNLFGAVEKSATAGGSNRTLLGKGIDVAKQADAVVNNIGKWLQNTKPVAAFDQKFENLKAAINKKFPDSKILDAVSKMGLWAQENPGKTAAIVGVLTAIAGLAAGPVGGAVAGQILRGSVELLKGEKLSTAIGKGIKTAAYGFIAGKTFELIGDALKGGINIVKDNLFPGALKINLSQSFDEIGGQFGSRYANFEVKGLIVKPEDAKDVQHYFKTAADAWRQGDYAKSHENWKFLEDYIENTLKSPEYIAGLAQDREKRQMIATAANGAKELFAFLGAAAQGAVAGAGVKGSLDRKAESIEWSGRSLSEGQVYMIFNRLQRLDEGPMDFVKRAGAKLSQMGTNLTTKITADKLNSAWQKAGAPTDSDQLAQFLAQQGVDANIVAQVYTDLKLPQPGKTEPTMEPTAGQTMTADQVQQLIAKLPTDRKVRLINYMTKKLKVA